TTQTSLPQTTQRVILISRYSPLPPSRDAPPNLKAPSTIRNLEVIQAEQPASPAVPCPTTTPTPIPITGIEIVLPTKAATAPES
ncbi:hypothetical protein PIB30_066502, partial [Stylosanthes scabra]|nr:hypothetical protein [Stylosanthes scabra]